MVNGHRFWFVIGNPKVTVDWVEYDFGQAPLIVDGYTLLPLRAFQEVLTAISWDAENRTIIIIPCFAYPLITYPM
jgi:hypothetical protein